MNFRKTLLLFTCLTLFILCASAVGAPPAKDADKNLVSGYDNYISGKYAEAEKLLTEYTKKNANDDYALVLLGRLYAETGKYEEAEKYFKAVGTRNASYDNSFMYLGDLYQIQGKYDDAEKMYLLANKANPKNYLTLAKLAEMLNQNWQQDKAKEYFKKIEEALGNKIPTTEEDALALGLARHSADDFEKARNSFEYLCTKIDERSIEGFLRWAWIYIDGMNYPRAEEKVALGMKINPNNPDLHMMAAIVLMHKGLFTPTMSHIDQGLAVNPNHVGLINQQAFMHVRDEQYEKGIEIYKKSLKINPNNLDTLCQLAATYYISDKMDDFSKLEKDILGRIPKYAPLYLTVGDFLAMRIRTVDALELYKKCNEIAPDYVPGMIALGMQYMRTPNESEGYELLEKAWDKDQKNPRVINMLNSYDNLHNPRLFRAYLTKHFTGFYEIDEAIVRGKYGMFYMEKCWDDFTKLFKFEPKTPILMEEFFQHSEFSARTSGLPGMAADGATFGQLMTILSPKFKKMTRRSSNWASVVRHEICHVFTIQLSNYRIPRWYTEALSMWSENNPRVYWDTVIYKNYITDNLWKIKDLNQGFNRPETIDNFMRAYCQAFYVGQFLDSKYGTEKMMKMIRLFGDKKTTEEVLKAVLNLTPEEFDKQFKAYIGSRAKEFDTGEFISNEEMAALEKRIVDNPNDADALGKLAWFGTKLLPPRMRGEPKDIAEKRAKYNGHMKKCLELDPENPYCNILVGYMYLGGMRPNFPEAMKRFEIAVKKLPDSLHANYMLGYCMMAVSRGKMGMKAAEYFKKCKEVYPRAVYGMTNAVGYLAKIYLQAGLVDEAQKELEYICKLNLDDAWAFAELGKLYAKKDDWKKTAETLDEALKIDPFNIVSQHTLAKAFEKAGQLEKAIMHYRITIYLSRQGEEVAAANIDTVEVQAKVATLFDKLNNKDMAIRYALRVLRKDDTFAECEAILKKYNVPVPTPDYMDE